MKMIPYHKKLMAILVPFLLILSVLSYISFEVTRNMVKQQVSTEIEIITQSIVDNLSSQVSMMGGVVGQVAEAPYIVNYLATSALSSSSSSSSSLAPFPADMPETKALLEQAQTVIGNAVGRYDIVSNMGVVDSNGVVVCSFTPEMQGLSLGKSSYVKYAMEGDNGCTTMISRYDNAPVAYISAPVRHNGSITGAVFGVIDLEKLGQASVARHSFMRNYGLALVLDKGGTILMHPLPEEVGKSFSGVPSLELVAEYEKDKIFIFEEPDNPVVRFAAGIPSTDWTAVFQVHKNELLKPINDLAHYNMIIVFAGIASTIIFMVLLTRHSAKIIASLGGIAEKMAVGNFRLTAREMEFLNPGDKAGDPLGRVCRSTRNIMDELQSISHVYQEKDNKAREAAMDAEECRRQAEEYRRESMLSKMDQLTVSVAIGRLEAVIKKALGDGVQTITDREWSMLKQDCNRADEVGKLCRDMVSVLDRLSLKDKKAGEVEPDRGNHNSHKERNDYVEEALQLVAPPLEQITASAGTIALQMRAGGTGNLWQAIYSTRQAKELGLLLKTVNAAG